MGKMIVHRGNPGNQTLIGAEIVEIFPPLTPKALSTIFLDETAVMPFSNTKFNYRPPSPVLFYDYKVKQSTYTLILGAPPRPPIKKGEGIPSPFLWGVRGA
jgi:hypothetical protein